MKEFILLKLLLLLLLLICITFIHSYEILVYTTITDSSSSTGSSIPDIGSNPGYSKTYPATVINTSTTATTATTADTTTTSSSSSSTSTLFTTPFIKLIIIVQQQQQQQDQQRIIKTFYKTVSKFRNTTNLYNTNNNIAQRETIWHGVLSSSNLNVQQQQQQQQPPSTSTNSTSTNSNSTTILLNDNEIGYCTIYELDGIIHSATITTYETVYDLIYFNNQYTIQATRWQDFPMEDIVKNNNNNIKTTTTTTTTTTTKIVYPTTTSSSSTTGSTAPFVKNTYSSTTATSTIESNPGTSKSVLLQKLKRKRIQHKQIQRNTQQQQEQQQNQQQQQQDDNEHEEEVDSYTIIHSDNTNEWIIDEIVTTDTTTTTNTTTTTTNTNNSIPLKVQTSPPANSDNSTYITAIINWINNLSNLSSNNTNSTITSTNIGGSSVSKATQQQQQDEDDDASASASKKVVVDVGILITNRAFCEYAHSGISDVPKTCTTDSKYTQPMLTKLKLAESEINVALKSINVQIKFVSYLFLNQWSTYDPIPNGTYISEMDDIKNVITLRQYSGADLIAVITGKSTNGICGIANQNSFKSLTQQSCLGQYTLQHELGHNLGGNHHRDDVSEQLHEYAYAYKNVDSNYRTVLSYTCTTTICPRIPYYSSSTVRTSTGQKLGNTLNDNLREIKLKSPIVSQYYQLTSKPVPVPQPVPKPKPIPKPKRKPISKPISSCNIRGICTNPNEIQMYKRNLFGCIDTCISPKRIKFYQFLGFKCGSCKKK